MRNRHNDQRQDQQWPPVATTDAGILAPSDESSLSVGPAGPV